MGEYGVTNKLQQQINELKAQKNKLLILVSEKDEKIQQLETRYMKDMKLVKKELNVSINTIIDQRKKYYLSMARFRSGQGFRIGWGEHCLSKDRQKCKNLNAYHTTLKTNSQKKKFPPLSVGHQYLNNITISNDEADLNMS